MQTHAARTAVSSSTAPTVQPTEGRQAAAARARTRHGLYSRHAVVLNEDPRVFEAQRRRYHRAWNPWDECEEDMVDNLAVAQWRLQRVNRTEGGSHELFERHQWPPAGATLSFRLARVQYMALVEKNLLGKNQEQYARLTHVISKLIRDLTLLQKARPVARRRGGQDRWPGATVSLDVLEPTLEAEAEPEPIPDDAPAPHHAPDLASPAPPEAAKESTACTKSADRGAGAARPAEPPASNGSAAPKHPDRRDSNGNDPAS